MDKIIGDKDISRSRISKANKHTSVYSLSINRNGNIIVCGNSNGNLRFWDTRINSHQCIFKVKGHADIVKSLVLNEDGNKCISGGSDKIIKLWDIGEQGCTDSLYIHDDSIWTMAADSSWTTLYSAGKDKFIYSTNLVTLQSQEIFQETHPVTDVTIIIYYCLLIVNIAFM